MGGQTTEPIIEFRDFSFQYRSQTEPTLRNIDLRIYPGEKILITGVSGSGKSTLAHCINALIPCSYPGKITGELTVAGLRPDEAGVFGMSMVVGTVLQDTDGQFIGLTVGEDIAFSMENDMIPQPDMLSRVGKVSEMVGMQEFLAHSPGTLSGGQKQRVSMGGVLVDDVRILLFDEPLANLDPATGKKTIALIDEICNRQNITVLIVEHRIEDVLFRDVDRVIVVGDGRIICDMHPDELVTKDILEREGIRQPLYIAAIKHALEKSGRMIDPADRPRNIETMDLTPYADEVRNWYSQTDREITRTCTMPCLEVRDVTFRYEDTDRDVLSDISFVINRGEMVSLVGKNGAGKSTLTSLICGFYDLSPGMGQIFLDGEDIAPLTVSERGERIGLVMQNPNQMISQPMIKDEVGLGLRVRGVSDDEIDERCNEALKICGLYPYRNWPVGALSFGQKKRVTIASILIMRPSLMILDEPTAGQDYRHYTEIMEFLKQLHDDNGLTMIMITHDMHLMLEYTDRAIVLADGRLLADDRPSRILTDPEIAGRAYLKETSLYSLAMRCGINEPDRFTESFISYERRNAAKCRMGAGSKH